LGSSLIFDAARKNRCRSARARINAAPTPVIRAHVVIDDVVAIGRRDLRKRGALGVRLRAGLKIVMINEIIAGGVVGRIDLNQLHSPEVGFLQKLKNLKIFSFEEHMQRIAEVDALPAFRNNAFQAC
jgi:hypothetical protein